MKITSELSDKIQKTINKYVDETEPSSNQLGEVFDLGKIAQELNVLPLVGDFGHCWGLRFDGEVVCFLFDNPEEVEVIGEDQKHFRNMRRRAYLVASREYAELQELMPLRPPDARICEGCRGTGREPLNDVLGYEEERFVCLCVGLGWLPKDENYEITITNLDEYFPKT